jgi:hypothetical protein
MTSVRSSDVSTAASGAVEHAGPHIGEGALRIGQVVPPAVQPGEGFLRHVLGGLLVAQHDVGQPDEAERVLLIKRGHRRLGDGWILPPGPRSVR